MSDSIYNYPFKNKIIFQSEGSGFLLSAPKSGLLSGNWYLNNAKILNSIDSGNLQGQINSLTGSNNSNYARLTGNNSFTGDNSFRKSIKIIGSNGIPFLITGKNDGSYSFEYTTSNSPFVGGNMQFAPDGGFQLQNQMANFYINPDGSFALEDDLGAAIYTLHEPQPNLYLNGNNITNNFIENFLVQKSGQPILQITSDPFIYLHYYNGNVAFSTEEASLFDSLGSPSLSWDARNLQGNWTKDNNYILTSVDSGNLQNQINLEKNKQTITGISISGGNSITGLINFSAGSNVTLVQQGNNTLQISASVSGGGGSQTPWTQDIDANGYNLSGINIFSKEFIDGDGTRNIIFTPILDGDGGIFASYFDAENIQQTTIPLIAGRQNIYSLTVNGVSASSISTDALTVNNTLNIVGAVPNGSYTVGIGITQNGIITVQGGIITAIQEAI